MVSLMPTNVKHENFADVIINESELVEGRRVKLRFTEDVLDYLEDRTPAFVNAVCLDPWCLIKNVDPDTHIVKVSIPGYGITSVTPEEVENVEITKHVEIVGNGENVNVLKNEENVENDNNDTLVSVTGDSQYVQK